jgi:hypothetical protein
LLSFSCGTREETSYDTNSAIFEAAGISGLADTMALKSRWFRRIAHCMYRNLMFIHRPVRVYKNYLKNC